MVMPFTQGYSSPGGSPGPVVGGSDLTKLGKQPRSVLLQVAVELDPDAVSELYEQGWSKEDLLEFIEDHVKAAIGNQSIQGWQVVQDVDVEESSASEEE